MVLPRIRRRIWEKWKQATGRHLSERQINYAEQFSSPHAASPKISENSWKRDEVRWWTLRGHIFKKVERTFFPGTPIERKTNAIFCYDNTGRLTRRSINGLFNDRVLEYNPPGKQFGKRKN